MQVVWDVKKGEALCGAPILATDVRCFHSNAQRFATCGSDSTLYMWQHDAATHKLARSDMQVLLSWKSAPGWICAVLPDGRSRPSLAKAGKSLFLSVGWT